jgi:hypothetical protein
MYSNGFNPKILISERYGIKISKIESMIGPLFSDSSRYWYIAAIRDGSASIYRIDRYMLPLRSEGGCFNNLLLKFDGFVNFEETK